MGHRFTELTLTVSGTVSGVWRDTRTDEPYDVRKAHHTGARYADGRPATDMDSGAGGVQLGTAPDDGPIELKEEA